MKQFFLVLCLSLFTLSTGCQGKECEVTTQRYDNVEKVEMFTPQAFTISVKNGEASEIEKVWLVCDSSRIFTDVAPGKPPWVVWTTRAYKNLHRECGRCATITIHVSDLAKIDGAAFRTVLQ